MAQLVWEKKKKGAFLSKTLTNVKEYIMVYCKSIDDFSGFVGEINKSTETYPCINAINKRERRIIPKGIESRYKEKNFFMPAGTKISDTTMEIIYLTFAGSGTTAHAVLKLNQEDGGNRKFILVEMEDYAEKITAERVRRIGGSFDFYEVGELIFDDDGELNKNVDIEQIREYIWRTETRTKYEKISTENKYYLGEHDRVGIYFNYEKDSTTSLNINFLSTIKIRAENYIIYADECLFSDEQLQKYKIIFKKIPRDVMRF